MEKRQNVVGPQVRRIRERLGLKQDDLAARCGVVGFDISRGTLAKIEAQVRGVSDKEVVALSKALRVPVAELFLFVRSR